MQQRLKGLQHECELLEAEIARHEAGDLREYDIRPDGTRIEITDLWLDHLKSVLAIKRSLRTKLLERYQTRGVREAGGV
jgi:hypothetical protein